MKRTLFLSVILAAVSGASIGVVAQASAHENPPAIDTRDTSADSNTVVTIDWHKTLRKVNPLAFGFNCPACFDPVWSSNPILLEPLATLTGGGRPLIRLHGWGMVTQGSGQCWLNEDGTWNADKIKRALTPLTHSGYQLMIDIPSGPGGEKNDPVDESAMAPFAAALVKIVNVDNKFGVKYWELPNEREKILSTNKMASMISRAAAAMKQIDATILVGGPAAEGINVDYVAEVFRQSHGALDFVSAHTYGGDGKQTAVVSYRSALDAISAVRKLRERLSVESPAKYIPIFVDEYNIGWDGNPGIYNNEGAVYFSIIQTGIVEAGADASAVWDFSPPHDMSIVDRDGHLTDSAHLFILMNQFFQGDEVASGSSDPATVRIFAVKAKSTRSMALSNLSGRPKTVTLEFRGRKPKAFDQYQISASGYVVKMRKSWNELVASTLPANSVTVLVAR